MRTFTLTLIATFFSVLSYGQATPEATVTEQTPPAHKSVMFQNNDNDMALAEQTSTSTQSAEYYDFNSMAARDGSRSCEKYKKTRTTGIVLASVGGGLLIGGAVMLAVAVNGLSSGAYYGNDVAYLGLIGGGVVFLMEV